MVQIVCHNICFKGVIWKIIPFTPAYTSMLVVAGEQKTLENGKHYVYIAVFSSLIFQILLHDSLSRQ